MIIVSFILKTNKSDPPLRGKTRHDIYVKIVTCSVKIFIKKKNTLEIFLVSPHQAVRRLEMDTRSTAVDFALPHTK